ncbi:MAG TPA: hypothetical protein VGO01_10005 [Bradyrhizobium sp.]|jgi:hypothetical protein|nr:hypothetical protein [Bradyrhizobium sp.]
MDSTTRYAKPTPSDHGAGDCAPVPEFRRLNYTYGQLLGVADFRAEQSYFREKQRLHNRCFHGYGVVCGLLVHPADDPRHCAPSDEDKAKEEALKKDLADVQSKFATAGDGDKARLDTEIADLKRQLKELTDRYGADAPPVRVTIDCGIALDCEGNELVVRRPLVVDLWNELSAEDRKRVSEDTPLYVSLCYCEQPVDPIRPVLADQCGAVADCSYGKLRESVRVHVSLTAPEEDMRCDTCCCACGECCLLLARIDKFQRGDPIAPANVHNEVRRRLGIYQSAVITGINWVHGGDYAAADAEKILGTDDANGGIEIHFSRPILTSSLRPGVVELWRVEGGAGRSSGISQIFGEFATPPGKETTVLRYRQTDEEKMDYGDRILIQVRCEFLLDRCCRPVDGAHVGGRVPVLRPTKIEPQSAPPPPDCPIPPWGYGPWTSGSGAPGSNFESWITIAEPPGRNKSGAIK